MIHIRAPRFLKTVTFSEHTRGLSLFCFLIYRDELTPELINHEEIHWRQCLEGLVIGFWIHYFYYLFTVGYRNIPYEKEAYENDHDLNYLKRRRFWQWLDYR